MFTSFEPIMDSEKLFMGNSALFEMKGHNKMILKKLTLNSVQNVPEICKNVVSGSLLSVHGFQMVFE